MRWGRLALGVAVAAFAWTLGGLWWWAVNTPSDEVGVAMLGTGALLWFTAAILAVVTAEADA